MLKKEQLPLTERLKLIRERCWAVPGGIKAVAKAMGRSENTLHNWFKGKTTPAIDDLELLKEKLEALEEAAEKAAKEQQRRLDAALS